LFCEAYAVQTIRARAKFRATIEVLRDQPTIEGGADRTASISSRGKNTGDIAG
jgi:hypothetical protein